MCGVYCFIEYTMKRFEYEDEYVSAPHKFRTAYSRPSVRKNVEDRVVVEWKVKFIAPKTEKGYPAVDNIKKNMAKALKRMSMHVAYAMELEAGAKKFEKERGVELSLGERFAMSYEKRTELCKVLEKLADLDVNFVGDNFDEDVEQTWFEKYKMVMGKIGVDRGTTVALDKEERAALKRGICEKEDIRMEKKEGVVGSLKRRFSRRPSRMTVLHELKMGDGKPLLLKEEESDSDEEIVFEKCDL